MKLLILAIVGAVALNANIRAADAPKETAPHGDHAQAAGGKVKTVNAAEFENLRAHGTNVVLDVRTPKEYAAGHVPNAINIDVNSPDFENKVKALDPSKTYLVHCAGGGRGAKACEKLGKLNFRQVYNLEGGMTAWKEAGNKPTR